MTPSRISKPIEADVPMFSMDGGFLEPVPEAPAEPDYTLMVSVKERAYSLNLALASLAQANMRSGFLQAVEGDPHYVDLLARYQSGLDKVTEGVGRNREDHQSTALYHFRHASGYWAMLKSGVVGQNELDVSTHSDLDAFKAKFIGGPEETKKRNAYRRDLQVQAGLAKPRRKKQSA
jgi:hypothetical protein